MFAKTVEVKGHFKMLYESYEMLIHEIREVSRDTGFQAVIYDEQENFQSYEILENFNYPFANRKQVKDEYYAIVPSNSSFK